MATTKSTETTKQLTYLSGALKAPRILDVAGRLADQARDAGWTFEDYLAAVLEREVSARNASGLGWVSAVRMPNPPAFETAEASSARPTHIIPP